MATKKVDKKVDAQPLIIFITPNSILVGNAVLALDLCKRRAGGTGVDSDALKASGTLIPVGLSDQQQSKLGYVAPEETVRRPSWLTAAEFEQLRLEAGE